ncbi:unnamed protein product [Gongylonema pulchrum]|uniref:ANK_REP_REGION domain-containing protein n=1 Tax=Gongylonema pulchrum TaxID=637853 RepID=A0A183D008_9BILA|nr:unnamed protein product [Gongylonema pulchrum]
MEQPVAQATADASSTSAQSTRTSSVSPGVPKRRIPKVHKKNERGETPLHVAARKGEHRQCKKLIQDGALVDARDYAGLTPLHEACYHGHFKVARLLISNGADVNAVSEYDDDTPLHDAVASASEKVGMLSLEVALEALLYMIYGLVWLLLHSGADRNRSDSDGRQPIDICRPECTGIRTLLLSPTVPDRCPGDESPSLSPSSSTHCVCYTN